MVAVWLCLNIFSSLFFSALYPGINGGNSAVEENVSIWYKGFNSFSHYNSQHAEPQTEIWPDYISLFVNSRTTCAQTAWPAKMGINFPSLQNISDEFCLCIFVTTGVTHKKTKQKKLVYLISNFKSLIAPFSPHEHLRSPVASGGHGLRTRRWLPPQCSTLFHSHC